MNPRARLHFRMCSTCAGTGKTTIARLIGRYLNAYGVLPRANFVERNGLELKGQYVGQTAPTVKQAVADAMGGTLFIDEAYALVDGGGDQFSGEAVRTLLTEVENNRTALMVVLAGYRDKMESLMRADEGLPRRFQRTLHLDDYTPAELAQICTKVARERFSLSIDPELERAIELHLRCIFSNGPCPAGSPSPCHNCQLVRTQNGGLAVNLVERAFKRLAQRVIRTSVPRNSPLLSVLAREDFAIGAAAPALAMDATEAEDLLVRFQAALLGALTPSALSELRQMDATRLATVLHELQCSGSS